MGGGGFKHNCIPNFSKWGLGTRPLLPYYFVYRPTIDMLNIINYRRGHWLKFEKRGKKEERFLRKAFQFKEEVPVHAHIHKQCHFDNSQS